MAKKRNAGRKEPKLQQEKALSRRDFFTSGAAAGVGAAVLSGSSEAHAQGIQWNYEADIVVLGSGCVGLHAAVRARDLGASRSCEGELIGGSGSAVCASRTASSTGTGRSWWSEW